MSRSYANEEMQGENRLVLAAFLFCMVSYSRTAVGLTNLSSPVLCFLSRDQLTRTSSTLTTNSQSTVALRAGTTVDERSLKSWV